jgi:hypothetical protein
MDIIFDYKNFFKDMENLVNYSTGFFEGAKAGKKNLVENFAYSAIDALKQYIDSNARVNPAMLSHMYEWYQTGSPEARLFTLRCETSNSGARIISGFRQSSSIKNGSNVPFYDKARIMEEGVPVTIYPTKSPVLEFEIDGQPIFTKGPITVTDPGGPDAQGGYEKIFNEFFNSYFTQAYIRSSGIFSHLEHPVEFKKNLASGIRGGTSVGFKTGYEWISKRGIIE